MVVRFVTLGATTMRRVIPFLFALCLIVQPSDAPGAHGQDAAPTSASPGWASLGPTGPFPTIAVAVSPNWPADKSMLVARPNDLARSPDGGATWESLPLPPGTDARVRQLGLAEIEPSRLAAAIGPGGIEVWFLLANDRVVGPNHLFRSTDRGASWTSVLTAKGATGPFQLLMPGSFASDGTAFMLADGKLLGSTDAGATWTPLSVSPTETVRQVNLSPAFERDRTVFARVSPANAISVGHTVQISPDANDQSEGITASRDGGATWMPASTGLDVERVRYRHVQDIAVSPTFETDQTLMAVAWGPPNLAASGTSEERVPAQVFISQDGAASWRPVGALPWAPYEDNSARPQPPLRSGLVTFSQTFSSDGSLLLATQGTEISGGHAGCAVFQSTDRAQTFTLVSAPASRGLEACRRPTRIMPRDSDAAVFERDRDDEIDWGPIMAPQGGWTWIVPPERPTYHRDGPAGVTFAPDGTMFVAGSRGIWALGPSVQQTAGTLDCATDIGDTFRAYWDTLSADGHADMGCPTGPEQIVSVDERISPNLRNTEETIRDYRTSDGAPWRVEAIGTPTYTRIVWRRPINEGARVQPQEPRTVSGIVQWTEHGGFLRLERWDGKTVTLITGPVEGDEREDSGTSLRVNR
jgi:hypothetical protein